MAENKTTRNDGDVLAYLGSVANKRRREDSLVMLDIMSEVTGLPAAMWGASIVGFGSYHYKYASGREGDFMLTGFAPRKQALTLYIMGGHERYAPLFARLGKHRTGKSCLYINKLADVDLDVLREIIAESVAFMCSEHPDSAPANE
ncbi:MAG: DUF1801 domain-containing protein [Chloroflexi bacterium]|nr:DUF1801 domain-containing protein [Chloroflexota bacterium]MCY3580978.1 DUF1801 domain-containing protein [Chloroflexota bacterium]MCY3717654.1 DUF1801 domain-containing protein [Chloroflexota bacterium]MDE2650525.1 DUF1801 domain-containing protein [Chloroflexota bacterium]MXX51100.1 DUF1801 domain-containing protein [Chloroflexota bacterium]